MAWDHLSITKSHLVYIILGGFTSLFMLCSSIIKERMYIGEATVATLCGLIFGPHAANLIDPQSWGNVDEVTLEFSRIVLVVQCFAVGVELPKFYMEKHWKSVVFLLLPVMTYGWLVTSLFVWWMVPTLSWLESLTVAACVTATDPVLASSVVGKGKFAKRVPKHLRDLLSAESGCNDGMAFPFIYLSLYLIQENLDAKQTTYHWLVYTVLYECIFGAIYGFLIGYFARHGIKYAEKHDLIDRESFLVFYFTLALFCAGSGSILGVDDLLVGFAAGVGFSNDGWFSSKTEESHVSNVIDLLINLAYFVFLGTIIPWDQFNNADLGLSAWRLVVIAIFVILFRRIPIMLALKPLIPDVKTWREAVFAGHFGPIGVGAIFVAILARAELETESTIPLAELPPEDTEHYHLIALVWPIVTFMVVSSILVHGSSVAVFTLGKRINTLSITMSYTAAPEDGPSWMNRLPRISSQSRSQARTTDSDFDDLKMPDYPPGTLPPTGMPGQFLRRQREEDNPSRTHSRTGSRASSRRRTRKKWDAGIGPGGPVTDSAIFPQRRSPSGVLEPMSPTSPSGHLEPDTQDTSGMFTDDEIAHSQMREKDSQSSREFDKDPEKADDGSAEDEHRRESAPEVEIYDEGDHIVVEDEEGQVLAVEPQKTEHHEAGEVMHSIEGLKENAKHEISKPNWTYESLKKRLVDFRDEEVQKRKAKSSSDRKHEPARAYQFGNTIIVEDEDGEVVKTYELPSQKSEGQGGNDIMATSLKYMGMGGLVKDKPKNKEQKDEPEAGPSEDRPKPPGRQSTLTSWAAFNRSGPGESSKKKNNANTEEEGRIQEEDDHKIRFTIGGEGRRMNKEDFLNEVRKMDARTKRQVLENSDAPAAIRTLANKQQGGPPNITISAPGSNPGSGTGTPSSSKAANKGVKIAGANTPPGASNSPDRSEPARGRPTTTSKPVPEKSSEAASDTPETAVERRRRLAALSGMRAEEEPRGEQETPAERRRREAALGLGSPGASDSDSEDDDTPRVPPARRGIRFADAPARGQK